MFTAKCITSFKESVITVIRPIEFYTFSGSSEKKMRMALASYIILNPHLVRDLGDANPTLCREYYVWKT